MLRLAPLLRRVFSRLDSNDLQPQWGYLLSDAD